MTVSIGSRYGEFEILAPLGAGGMGEVYRARDTKLGRDVAIKMLPDALSRDPDRRARFEREAKLLAALNHASIAHLYGFGEHEDTSFLVMELVEGETLAERIARGAIPLDEAIPMFVRIADGLEAAHAKGIVHRDLKPANVKLTADGGVKVLDFGLAKALAIEGDVDTGTSQSPTLTKGTALGAIMGTAAYMSPEQARGREIDKRTDLWAFGCCLFEALTGRRVFDGDNVTDVLAAVVRAEPDWSLLPEATPRDLRTLLRRLLRKNARERIHDVADARLVLSETSLETDAPGEASRPSASKSFGMMVAGALLGAVATAVVWGTVGQRPSAVPSTSPTMQLSIEIPAEQRLVTRTGDPVTFDISRDGSRLAFLGEGPNGRRVYVRDMGERDTRAVPGTDGAEATSLCISPDGEWVGFYRDATLWKTPVSGGIPVALVQSEVKVMAARWLSDDTVVYAAGFADGLWRIGTDGGGVPQALTGLVTEEGVPDMFHYDAEMLPGGKTILFTAARQNLETSRIEAVEVATGRRHTVLEDGFRPRYTASGHLVFHRGETLFAAPFDVDTVEVTGPAAPVVSGVLVEQIENRGAFFALAGNGTLVYVPREEAVGSRPVWVSRDGTTEETGLPPNAYRGPRLSPKGDELLVRSWTGEKVVISHHDFTRGVTATVTPEGDSNHYPAWSPDGRRFAFQSSRAGNYTLFTAPVDGGEAPVRLLSSDGLHMHPAFTPDGRFLLYTDGTFDDRFALHLLPLVGEDRAPIPFVTGSFNAHSAAVSPDGGYVAYVGTETGREEIYVTELSRTSASPTTRTRRTVSSAGGWEPVWARDGKELYFRSHDGKRLMATSVRTEPALNLGEPRPLLDTPWMAEPIYYGDRAYDVAPDGRFLMLKDEETGAGPMRVFVVLGWFEVLKARVPVQAP